MARTIWRYEITISDDIEVEMPEYSEVLHFAMQGNVPCIWVLVVPDSNYIIKKFKMFGTGHPVYNAEVLEYIGTVMLFEGAQVYHLFEVVE